MSTESRRVESGAVLVTLLAMITMAANAGAAQLTVTKRVSEQEQMAAAAFWTRERIAAAPALPLPVDRGSGAIDRVTMGNTPVGPVGLTPAQEAAWDADLIAQSAYWQDWVVVDDEVLDTSADPILGSAGTYTYYNVNNNSAIWQIYPHRWDGKLTFQVPGDTASCSATVISGNNIVTAAHCVYDTSVNQFFSNWIFTPAYRNGSTPYGTFTASACTVLTAWINLTGTFNIATWSRHDVAVCTLNTNSVGQTINTAVGWAGRTWNVGNAQLVFNSGYPARFYTDAPVSSPGQYLRSCTAETFLFTTETLGSGCFWGRGISGGSWLTRYQPFLVSGHVNSVNSGLFFNQQNLYGARFNSNNIVPLCNTRGC